MSDYVIPASPLFRDPIFDGAADPTIIWNHHEQSWWIVYTNRRATAHGQGVAWVHGTDLGVASSTDNGQTWTYRGVLEGLDVEWGRNTFWAPEIIYHHGTYHMYVSYIQGVPVKWEGHKRQIIHYTSSDLLNWTFESILNLSSEFVIDACIHELPEGGFRMWYKDEANHSHTYAADSKDLYHWSNTCPVLTEYPHEGPNVFYYKKSYWMLIDKWEGLAVYQSSDCKNWSYNTTILHTPGTRKEDGSLGYHADVHVNGEEAYVFYFTHPTRDSTTNEDSYEYKRSSLQVARLDLQDGLITCDRNKNVRMRLQPY
ncbi:glycosyl hydrolase [Paenalkalicoccus suaedae]|uniref:Glycosyl hydrolase n=1 Tax=Paenalkalicoccus suaedae TaxID=2592382 RepID=A0A859FA49_9BACI|nr:glycosyl hydrolase [Paenalkalicoccus suaedae]QKS69760.1 glycosyl hydrolase [Paenalkalicoccus suaedae]